MGQWHSCLNCGATTQHICHAQGAPKLLHPFLHVAQAQTGVGGLSAPHQALAIVADLEGGTPLMPAQVDLHLGGPCVPLNIGQRLLGNSVQRDLGVIVQSVTKHHRVKMADNPGAGLEFLL